MKKTFILLFILIFHICGKAQSIYNLDEKNGFKKFIFGEHKWQYLFYELKEKWKEEVGDKFIIGYEVILDDNDKKVGPNSFESLYIFFYDNKLYKIILWLPNDKDLKGIYNTLTREYGPPTQQTFKHDLDLNYDEYNAVKIDKDIWSYFWCIWKGNKVRLTISTNLSESTSWVGLLNQYSVLKYYNHEIKFINIKIENEILQYQKQYNKNKIDKAVDDL